MKQIKRLDYANSYEYQQAKKQVIKQCNNVKLARQAKRNINFN